MKYIHTSGYQWDCDVSNYDQNLGLAAEFS